ncbi:hypothetical protein QQ054_16965 [Oscillatoria amoena NRMC-F 0135]|nr:hypothetical protein [Oscillatoria amoena NRMC-F 0135]
MNNTLNHATMIARIWHGKTHANHIEAYLWWKAGRLVVGFGDPLTPELSKDH